MILRIVENSSLDVTNMTKPVIARSEWNSIPTPIPKLVQIATFLLYLKLCLVTNAKSGPGLATANKCKIATVRNSIFLN